MSHSLPVVSLYKDFPEAGGLFAYGASPGVIYRRTAYYVDRILNGAKPSELPVEQPTKFDLIVNRKTANALGLGERAARRPRPHARRSAIATRNERRRATSAPWLRQPAEQ